MRIVDAAHLAKLNPKCKYTPLQFDYLAAMTRAHSLFEKVREYFPSAILDGPVQDATHHAGITLESGEIRLSNFARLATICSGETFEAEMLSSLVNLIEDSGYTYVPFPVFGKPFLERERFNGDLFNQLFDYL